MKVLVGTFKQEKALVGAFSVIVKTGCGTDGALNSTNAGLGDGTWNLSREQHFVTIFIEALLSILATASGWLASCPAIASAL